VAFMASPAAYQKNGLDWMKTNMVGTGPFVQKDFQRDVSLTFTRNPNYWEQWKPYLDGIQLLYVADSTTSQVLFMSGGGDIMAVANPMVASKLRDNGYGIIKVNSNGAAMIPDSLNADSPWSKLKVRQAAEFAIDKEAIAKTFGYGAWEAAYQYNGSTSPAYDATLTPRKYDVAKAKQLLAEAGYPDGVKTSIILSPFGMSQDVAIAVQAYFNAVGIKVDIQYPQAAAWSAMLTGTWKNAVLLGPAVQWANPAAGWNLTFAAGSTWYQSLKKPDGWADLYKAALSTPKLDPSLVQKCEDALFNDANSIPLYLSASQWALTGKVMDSGLGTRGIGAWWEPQNTWLSQ
jgi:ABC-type transport system substrate-binding protein